MFIASFFTIAKKMKTTLMLINGGMDKQKVVYPSSGILFSKRKK